MRPIDTTRAGARGLGGGGEGGWEEGGACVQEDRTPAVEVRVSRFLRHPAGHTVYQVDVQLRRTRQVWSVFKRYRDFVSLRQQLKTACRAAPQQQQLATTPPSTSSLNTPATRSFASGVRGRSINRKAGATAAAVKRATVTVSPALAQRRRAAIEGIRTVLADFKFPSKIAFSGSLALKAERRKALNEFFGALVDIRPLPQNVAVFLGLLSDNRLGLDQHGNYVQVMHTVNVPIPESPGNHRQKQQVPGPTTACSSDAAKPRGEPPASPTDDFTVGSVLTPNSATTFTPAVDAVTSGGVVAIHPTRSTRVDGDSGRVGVRGGVSPQECALVPRPSVGARAWEGVSRVGLAGSGPGEAEASSWSSDTDETVDCESGAESESGLFGADHTPGNDRSNSNEYDGGGRLSNDQVGVAKAEHSKGFPTEADEDRNAETRVTGGDMGADGNRRGIVSSPDQPHHASPSAPPPSPPPPYIGDGKTTRGALPPAEHVVTRLRGGAGPVARLKGGGGDGDSDENTENDGDEEGWSFVGLDDARDEEGGRGVAGEGAVDLEQQERVIQWKFVMGFLEQVVSSVVARQDLADGIGEPERSRSFPLSEEDQNLRMAELLSLGVDLPKDRLVKLLRYKDWGPQAATALYQNLIAAGKGSLDKVIPGGMVRGMENGGNTCYIDSLLFAMFATLDAFDWLLLKTLPATDPPEVKLLQKHLRFLVNQLRQGEVIPREQSNLVRQHLRTCGWQGGSSTQEDVSELFTFLVVLLRCPALPLSEALFHGGKSEDSDSRISTERALYLALPPEEELDSTVPRKSSSPARGTGSTMRRSSPPLDPTSGKSAGGGRDAGAVTLEQLLMHNFHDNRVEGLRRKISGEKGSQPVDAWRMVSMLPFYALSGEHAADSDPSNDLHFDTVMLPMVLKRYEPEEPGVASSSPTTAVRSRTSRREVVVPLRLDCSKFMTPASGGKGGSGVDHGRFVLVLRSAVCHLGGENISKGHYVAYTADRHTVRSETGGTSLKESAAVRVAQISGTTGEEGFEGAEPSVSWLRLDDLKRDPAGRGFVEKIESVQDTNRVFSEDLGRHSYMLFYELVALNLDHVDKAQLQETYRLIETQQDFEYAQRVQQTYNITAHRQGAGKGSNSEMCSIS